MGVTVQAYVEIEDTEQEADHYFILLDLDGEVSIQTNMTDEQITDMVADFIRGGESLN